MGFFLVLYFMLGYFFLAFWGRDPFPRYVSNNVEVDKVCRHTFVARRFYQKKITNSHPLLLAKQKAKGWTMYTPSRGFRWLTLSSIVKFILGCLH